jgi:DNA-binding response OmpR family regulator
MSASPASPTILVVDDEESIRTMLRLVLESEGYAVTAVGSVPQALKLISDSRFDVLISDLNIGHPADGFVLVSAMRRTHPQALTLLLTGYPGFESALEAMRRHVNQYMIKGTPVEELIANIKAGLETGQSDQPGPASKRVPAVIEENADWVIEEWLQRVEAHDRLGTIPLSREDRKDHVPGLLEEAIAHARDRAIHKEREEAAERHGRLRYRQGYTAPLLITEARLLQNVIAECIRRNFLMIDLSHLVSDMAKISDKVNTELEGSMRAFSEQQGEPTLR